MNEENKKYYLYENTLTDIADSIRAKIGIQDKIKPIEMADKIESINYNGMFYTRDFGYYDSYNYCKIYKLIKEVPNLEIASGSYFHQFFYGCSNLEKVGNINITTNRYPFQNDYVFYNCTSLKSLPIITYSGVLLGARTYQGFASGCTSLENIPFTFNFSQLNDTNSINAMFMNCPNLTDESLDNILKSCLTTGSSYAGDKTLSIMGFNATNYPASRIESLPSYQNFINAGWTIGY